jgi:hypothetical protein
LREEKECFLKTYGTESVRSESGVFPEELLRRTSINERQYVDI